LEESFPTIALEDLEWAMRREGVEKGGELDETKRGICERHWRRFLGGK